jgi:ADP-ribose pyrophosphatase YjhB (NUDIX family)
MAKLRLGKKLHMSRGATHARMQFQEAKHKRDVSGKFAEMPGQMPGADGTTAAAKVTVTPATTADWMAGAKTSKVGGDDLIKLHVQSNPKKPGSAAAERFAKYQDGMTVAEYKAAGGTAEDLAWDRKRGFVTFHDKATYASISTSGASPVAQINHATATGRLASIKAQTEAKAGAATEAVKPPPPEVPIKASGEPPEPPAPPKPVEAAPKPAAAAPASPASVQKPPAGPEPAPKPQNAPTGTPEPAKTFYKPAPAPTALSDDTMVKHWASKQPVTMAEYKASLGTNLGKHTPDSFVQQSLQNGDLKVVTPAAVPKQPKPTDPAETLTFKKGDTLADTKLNGVEMRPWQPPKDAEGWKNVDGQMHLPDEPPMPTMGKLGSGVLIREPDGRVWVVKPTNEFGGYKHTFPKGTIDKHEGLSPQANAIKETFEESGLKVKITGFAGDFQGDTGVARYYYGQRTDGTPLDHGWESEAVLLVPPGKLNTVLNKKRDLDIAAKHLPDITPDPDQLATLKVSVKPQTPHDVPAETGRWGKAASVKASVATAAPPQNWDTSSVMTDVQKQEMRYVRDATGLKYHSGDDNEAVGFYTYDGHEDINGGLRVGGTLSPEAAQHVKTLDGMMAETANDVVVWRGMKSAGLNGEFNTFNTMPPPMEFVDPAYGSTSINPAVAHQFAGGHMGKTVVFKVRVPKGTKAMSVGREGDVREGLLDEAEIVLARGTRYKYVTTHTNQTVAGENVNVIELTVVSNNGAPVTQQIKLPKKMPDNHRYEADELVDLPAAKVADEGAAGLKWEYEKEYHQYGGHSWVTSQGGTGITNQADFNKRYAEAPLTYLTNDQYDNLGYTSINTKKLPTFASVAPGLKQRNRDPDAMRDRMLSDDGVTTPPIVLRKNGKLRLMAGQSRIWVGLATGYRVPVKVLEV